MDLKAHIGSRVRQARLTAGLTQESFAEALDKSARTISSIESGHTLASLLTLELAALKLGKPIAYFFEGLDPVRIGDLRRNKSEQEAKRIIETLSNTDLKLATALLSVLSAHSKS